MRGTGVNLGFTTYSMTENGHAEVVTEDVRMVMSVIVFIIELDWRLSDPVAITFE
jgi:hypothetical protein